MNPLPRESGFCSRSDDGFEIVWHGRQFFVEGRWYKLIGFVDVTRLRAAKMRDQRVDVPSLTAQIDGTVPFHCPNCKTNG